MPESRTQLFLMRRRIAKLKIARRIFFYGVLIAVRAIDENGRRPPLAADLGVTALICRKPEFRTPAVHCRAVRKIGEIVLAGAGDKAEREARVLLGSERVHEHRRYGQVREASEIPDRGEGIRLAAIERHDGRIAFGEIIITAVARLGHISREIVDGHDSARAVHAHEIFRRILAADKDVLLALPQRGRAAPRKRDRVVGRFI